MMAGAVRRVQAQWAHMGGARVFQPCQLCRPLAALAGASLIRRPFLLALSDRTSARAIMPPPPPPRCTDRSRPPRPCCVAPAPCPLAPSCAGRLDQCAHQAGRRSRWPQRQPRFPGTGAAALARSSRVRSPPPFHRPQGTSGVLVLTERLLASRVLNEWPVARRGGGGQGLRLVQPTGWLVGGGWAWSIPSTTAVPLLRNHCRPNGSSSAQITPALQRPRCSARPCLQAQQQLKPGTELVCTCAHGRRGGLAAVALAEAGLSDKIVNLAGGLAAWSDAELPHEGTIKRHH